MGLESPTNFVSDLVETNPVSTDSLAVADNHIRGIKSPSKPHSRISLVR